MWRMTKAIFFLIVLAGLALIAYAYLGPLVFPGDFTPPNTQVTQPVTLDTN